MNLNENLFECSEQKKPTPKSDAYKIWAGLKENESIDLKNLDEWAVRRTCCENNWPKDLFMKDLTEELSEQKPLTEETIGQAAEKINAEVIDTGDEDDDEHNYIFKALDRALKRALLIQGKRLKRQYPNIMLHGEGGLGKTAMVSQWADRNNINLVNKKASTMDETDLGGAMSPSTERKGIAQRLTTDDFDSLDKPRSVLFLDEYNRARPEVRTPLMELVNNHIIPDNREASGFRFLPNFLFTVAAINPDTKKRRYEVIPLDSAEMTRFSHIDVVPLIKSFKSHLLKELKSELDAIGDDEDFADLVLETKGKIKLAETILNSDEFKFDDTKQRDDDWSTPGYNKIPLDYRSFEQAIMNSDGTKEGLLAVWKQNSNNLRYDMIEDILENYVDVDDKANDALKGGTDSDIFKKRETNWDIVKNVIKGMQK